ncbi:MAG TPA: DUF1992 domain-containing protein [Anaerolineales bacterium]|nr:DUF1992 domain-containing protein [Anaerolineales bacterium]
MSFESVTEAIIKEAMERGEFDNLPGRGKPLDLTAYFATPEEVRAQYSILKNAGILPREAELLKEIAALKQAASTPLDGKKRLDLPKEIEKKQIEFNLMLERNHQHRKEGSPLTKHLHGGL